MLASEFRVNTSSIDVNYFLRKKSTKQRKNRYISMNIHALSRHARSDGRYAFSTCFIDKRILKLLNEMI